TLDIPIFGRLFDVTGAIYGLIAWLGFYALQGAINHVFAADLNGRTPSLRQGLSIGLQFLIPVLCISLIMVISFWISVWFLIAPALFLLTIWSMATPIAVFERQGVGESLARSAGLTQGYRWNVFAIGAVFFGVCVIVHSILGNGEHHRHIEDAGEYFNNVFHAVRQIVLAVFDTVVAPIGALLTASTYLELRHLKEGAGPEDLADLAG
ncbi:MAG TPA: hypothetical protein VFN88_09305, partial [Caulobacteraceae bacterium]|nr:hypothetical protein [Caulobacteraceae bacterium]